MLELDSVEVETAPEILSPPSKELVEFSPVASTVPEMVDPLTPLNELFSACRSAEPLILSDPEIVEVASSAVALRVPPEV